jgi:flagellin
MYINDNMAALSADSYLSKNNDAMTSAITQLSSGYRINSAADNAAGYVISENMDTQVQGMTQATQNTQDGINMMKTANSALDEVETQLNNMRNLTLHAASANGDATSLAADQAQFAQAAVSISRIASNTSFNGKNLLGATGSNISGASFQIGSNQSQTVAVGVTGTAADMTTAGLGVGAASDATKTINANGPMMSGSATATLGTTETLTINGQSVVLASTMNRAAVLNAINSVAGTTGVTAGLTDYYGNTNSNPANNTFLTFNATTSTGAISVASSAAGTAANTGIGTLALTASQGAGIDLTSASTNYNTVLGTIDAALAKVQNLQVNLGAIQSNSLQSNLNSLSVASQNTQSSESDIRDTDMAAEMVNFTKSQILTQAAQAMLTQANSAPQNILQMLKG